MCGNSNSPMTDSPPEEKSFFFIIIRNYWCPQQKTEAYGLEGEAKHSGKMILGQYVKARTTAYHHVRM